MNNVEQLKEEIAALRLATRCLYNKRQVELLEGIATRLEEELETVQMCSDLDELQVV